MIGIIRVTKDKETVILDFGKHGKNFERASQQEFENLLSRMKDKGTIAFYEIQHINKRDEWTNDDSITYRIVKSSFQPHARLRELQKSTEDNPSESGVVIQFPNNR